MARRAPVVATYSIAACDLDAKQWGVAVHSKFLAVGSVVPWAEPGAGAVATQAYANPRYGPDGLSLLRQGLAADEVVERLIAADDDPDERQLGVVEVAGGVQALGVEQRAPHVVGQQLVVGGAQELPYLGRELRPTDPTRPERHSPASSARGRCAWAESIRRESAMSFTCTASWPIRSAAVNAVALRSMLSRSGS